MELSEVFKNLTVLKDYSLENPIPIFWIITGAVMVLGGIVRTIYKAWDLGLEVGHVVIGIATVLFGAGILTLGMITLDCMPYYIDLYISTESIELKDINKYFDVTEVEHINDTIACRIVPKTVWYDEVLEIYTERNRF